VTLIFVGFNLIPSTFWMNSVIETRLGTLLSCLQMVSHAMNYFPRKAALAAAAPREHEEHNTAVNSMQLAEL
jgi:hypothetical protein